MDSTLKVSVVGAGALGSLIGGLLAEAGASVVLVNPRRKEHIDAINEKGLTIITSHGEERTIKCQATTAFDKVGTVDLLILGAKAPQTEVAMKSSLPMIAKETIAISLQNGIGCEEIMGEVIGAEKVIGALTMQGGEYHGPGRIYHNDNLPTYIGELDQQETERAKKLADIFNAAGIETILCPDIRQYIWSKVLFCLALDPMSAICRFKVGELFDVELVKEVIFEAVQEGVEVARAEGILIDAEAIAWVKEQLAEAGTVTRSDSPLSGVQVDILRQRKTDIDFKNGAIVRFGKKHGIPTPVNKTLWAAIKGLERNFIE